MTRRTYVRVANMAGNLAVEERPKSARKVIKLYDRGPDGKYDPHYYVRGPDGRQLSPEACGPSTLGDPDQGAAES